MVDTTQFPFLVTGEQLNKMKFAPPEWIVEDIVQANDRRMSLLVGKPESGKSTLGIQLCASVLKAEPFLAKLTTPSPVLYWQTEAMPRNIKESLSKLGYDPARDAGLYTFTGKPVENTLENLHAVLTVHPNIRLVIVETLDSLLHFKDIKENSFVKEGFDKFDNVMADLLQRVAFLGIAQLKKNETENSGDMLLGATEIRARTGIKLYLRTKSDEDPRRIFHTTVRQDGTAIKKTFMDYDPATGRSTLGETLEEERRGSGIRTQERIERDLNTYLSHHEYATEDELCAFVTGKKESKTHAIRRLVSVGRWLASGKGVKKDPRTYNLVPMPVEDTSEGTRFPDGFVNLIWPLLIFSFGPTFW